MDVWAWIWIGFAGKIVWRWYKQHCRAKDKHFDQKLRVASWAFWLCGLWVTLLVWPHVS